VIRGVSVLVALLLAAGCSGHRHPAAGFGAGRSPTPTRTCTVYAQRTYPPNAVGTPFDSARSVPFTDVDGPFDLGGTRWSLIDVSSSHPATFGVVLGHDEGMAVDLVQFLVKPYAYKGGDYELPGAVWNYAMHDVRAEGQRLMATFRGRDNSGRPLPRGVYKVELELLGHRTSMNTCIRNGPVPLAYSTGSSTGTIYGLASIGGAPRPKGAG
jgi:hypothetical protein